MSNVINIGGSAPPPPGDAQEPRELEAPVKAIGDNINNRFNQFLSNMCLQPQIDLVSLLFNLFGMGCSILLSCTNLLYIEIRKGRKDE